MRHRHIRGEAGSATAWAMPALAVLVLVTLLLSHLAAALVERRQAESAADLAALAGAVALQDGRDGCAAARRVAARNEGELVACSVDGLRVGIRVARTLQVPLVGEVAIGARARAGPATS